jgi:RNA recognition motif-containing protein
MGTRLYVGNLPFEIDEDELRRLFESDGRSVNEVSIVTDRDTGRPRGFAFVEMASQKDAQAAISALNGHEVGGRSIAVNEAARERSSGGGGGGGGGGGRRRY